MLSPAKQPAAEKLNYRFLLAVGDRIPQAHPDFAGKDPLPYSASVIAKTKHAEPATADYVKKVKLQKKTTTKGGCG